jgi:hypothetical protein
MNRLFLKVARLVLAGIVSWAIGGIGAAAEAQTRFRDLVYKTFDEDDHGALASQIGLEGKQVDFTALEYKVLLLKEPGAAPTLVDPKTHRFTIGQQIKVLVRPLTRSHVYVYHVGASGRGSFLVPREDEEPAVVAPKKEIAIPQEGYFEFVPPPGDEVLYVIATREPVWDRAVLAQVVTSKNPENDTPQMKEQRKQINAVVESVVKSEAEKRLERNDGSIKYRGLLQAEDRKAFVEDLKSRGVTWGSVELPPEKPNEATVALGFRSADAPSQAGTALVVTIPLRSAGSGPAR